MEKNDSFILYQRYENQISLLTMEQRGELLTAIFAYNGTGIMPDVENAAVKMALLFITEQLDYDKSKYDLKCKKNAENIAKRWNAKKSASANTNEYERIRDDTNVYERIPDDTKRYLSDSDTVSDTDTDSDSVSECVNTPGAPARTREKRPPDESVRYKLYGRYRNVRLTDPELAELKSEFADIDKRIERLSEYIAGHGDRYQNHCAVIREWSNNGRDSSEPAAAPDRSGFDTEEFFGAALARAERLIDRDGAEILQGLKAAYGDDAAVDTETGEVAE